jgi:hypothetical protein
MKQKRLTGGYFGTRRADFFPQEFVDIAKSGSRFCDITAGTGQFPYRMVTEYKTPVLLIERCPYVGYLLRSIFEGYIRACPYPGAMPLPQGSRIGYLPRRRDLVNDIFSPEMAARIDFLATHAQDTKDVTLSYAIGAVINSTFTFRSRNYCRTQSKGSLSIDVPVEKFDTKLYRVIDSLRQFFSAIAYKVLERNVVYLDDSCKMMPKLIASGLFEDAIVYADPAWPWAAKFSGAKSDNPYGFHFEEVSSILEQRQLVLDELWTRDDHERIKADTLGWIDAAFKGGARHFISCTQDTNFPDPAEVRQWYLDLGYKVQDMTITDHSASANRDYINYWFILSQ